VTSRKKKPKSYRLVIDVTGPTLDDLGMVVQAVNDAMPDDEEPGTWSVDIGKGRRGSITLEEA